MSNQFQEDVEKSVSLSATTAVNALRAAVSDKAMSDAQFRELARTVLANTGQAATARSANGQFGDH